LIIIKLLGVALQGIFNNMARTIFERTDLTQVEPFRQTITYIIRHLEDVIYSNDMYDFFSINPAGDHETLSYYDHNREIALDNFYKSLCDLEREINFSPNLDKSLLYWFRLRTDYITNENIDKLSEYIYDETWSHYDFPIWNTSYIIGRCRVKKIRIVL
jgi:hypothetical protein